MCEDHKKQLNILGEIRDQIKRLADLAEPTKLIMKESKPTPPDALVEAVENVLHHYIPGDEMLDEPMGKLRDAFHKKAVTK